MKLPTHDEEGRQIIDVYSHTESHTEQLKKLIPAQYDDYCTLRYCGEKPVDDNESAEFAIYIHFGTERWVGNVTEKTLILMDGEWCSIC
jgi:hypothetical protein